MLPAGGGGGGTGKTLNCALSPSGGALLTAAFRVYPTPVWLRRRLANVATPATALAAVAPESRAFFATLPSCPRDTRMAPVKFVALLSRDRKSTRLNSSHVEISYAVFCLKKKKKTPNRIQ